MALNESLLAAQPDDPAILNNLALLYARTGDARALTFAERANELVPSHPATMDTLGWVLLQKGELNRALVLLRDAHLRAPEEPEVRYHLAVALAELGQTAEARGHLEEALRF